MPIHTTDHGWVIETRSTGYALGVNPIGLIVNSYWGKRLAAIGDYPPPPAPARVDSFNSPAHGSQEEYPGYEDIKFVEPSIKAMFADGVRTTELRLAGSEVVRDGAPELRLRLRDTVYPLEVTLHYRAHEEHDLIERWVTVRNAGEEPIALERIWSAKWHLPIGERYRMSHVSGRWLDEMRLHREALLPGVKTIESRRITSSHHHNPWFAIDRGTADEERGAVWFGALAWSGNWKLAAEVDAFAITRINIGLNDWDFAWNLLAGSEFVTPAAYGGYSEAGFGGASRLLHDFIRDRLLPHGGATRKVLYNSWEATTFDVDEESQIRLAELAAAMGVELFVMDDGWFHGRRDDTAALGDWWPDEAKFPNGLGGLIERVNKLGMDFGLWIEPEMVNPDSDLYRAHPDWVIHFPTRPRTEGRNQLILNVARRDVQDYLIAIFDRLLSENKIAFIKWDMNRNVSEPGWPDAPGDQRELWVRYVEGLYRVWGTLRERHPAVVWQSCSGGGGRADLGILRLADQVWISDNTEPTARLGIQEGYSQIFPANTMEAWVTEMGGERLPLAFRFHVSMCGSLGVGGHLVRWSPEQRAEAARWIALYKEIRHIVQNGDLYRLRPAQEQSCPAVQYVSKDRAESVLFAFRTHLPLPGRVPPIYLRGLDPAAGYRVEGVDGIRSGAAWMAQGLVLPLQDYESAVRRITRI